MKSENQEENSASTGSEEKRIPLEVLASQFVDEHRRWLNPSVENYAAAYPEYAAEIFESFPVLIAMEQLKGNREVASLQLQLPDQQCVQQLGDCRIVREIDRSRTSVLYEAEQGKLNRRVAVKLLPWKAEKIPRWRERFEREARMIARLRHRNIVSIYSIGEDQGYCYSVMQLVNGVGLDKIILRLAADGTIRPGEIIQPDSSSQQNTIESEKPDDYEMTELEDRTLRKNAWRAFASIGLQAAKALQYSHSQGTLHNDIKPENILLDGEGHTWLTDFSLAQFAEGTLKQQDAKTLRCMAPERFRGRNDEQSDLYSLGMVLYELATLTSAFHTRRTNQLIDNILNVEPLRPREISTRIPAGFETIILNCIAKSPAQRYQTARELSLDFLRFMNGKRVEHLTTPDEMTDGKWFEFWKNNSGPQGQ